MELFSIGDAAPNKQPLSKCTLMKKKIKNTSLLLSMICIIQLAAEERDSIQSPIVTCHLMGGLGNQLFQIATTMAYAWDNGATSYFPDLNKNEYDLIESRDKMFFRLNNSPPPEPCTDFFQESCWHCPDHIPFNPRTSLYGYFQSWKHFHHHRDKLLKLFSPSGLIAEHLDKNYRDLISHPNTVSIHLRTFNIRLHQGKTHPFIGLSYYKDAIDFFPEDALFVVFSDRINWCKYHFSNMFANNPKRQFIYIEERDPFSNFFLMSKMKHHILANSTFSWWAAYLNENPDKFVIAPHYWMHPEYYAFPAQHPNDFYFPDWITVMPDFNEPYPFDMTWFDETTSLDGNG